MGLQNVPPISHTVSWWKHWQRNIFKNVVCLYCPIEKWNTKAIVKGCRETGKEVLSNSMANGTAYLSHISTPNTGAPQYVRQMLTSMKEEINNNTIIVGDFNTTLTSMDRSTKQKINKETRTLNDTIDQLDLIGIYRTFHPKTMNFTFFSSAHGTSSRIDHILGHKSSLGKLKKK